jgi:hypothetical protein
VAVGATPFFDWFCLNSYEGFMSLIHDIQAAAISQITDLPTLLRMCKLLAARISHEQFAHWVDCELNGYPDVASLPDYRVVRVESYGSFFGTYAKADRLQVPLTVLPENLQEHFSLAYLGSSISAYAMFEAKDKAGTLREPWPLDLAVNNASAIATGMQCISAWKEIPMGAVVGLLDSVKTRVLGFAIDLEKEAPNAGEMPIGSTPPLSREKMTQIYNTNIVGNVGNISNSGENYSQSSTLDINTGDWDTLVKRLADLGLRAGELDGIQADYDAAARSNDIQEKRNLAGGWISRLTSKLFSGGTGVALEVGAAGVAKAIASYFGLPGA